MLIGRWGMSMGPADVDKSLYVDVGDLLLLLNEWSS